MYKIIISLLIVSLVIACKRKSYITHKLKFEKIADACTGEQPPIRMNSNINGERYEFNECLSADFTKEQMTIARKGDTLMVQFVRMDSPGEKLKVNQKKSLYKMTLDIDAYPRYNFMTIDDNTFMVVPAGN